MYAAALYKFLPKHLVAHKFVKVDFSKKTKDIQQYDKKSKKVNQWSGRGWSQTSPRFCILIVVIKDKFV